MQTVQKGPIIGQLAVLGLLAGTTGLSAVGWLAGIACGAVTTVALGRGLARSGAQTLGPANTVTLTRATLVGGVTALVVDALVMPVTSAATTTLVALAVVALVLDGVDGRVARRTGTVSAMGARFDMEVDAFLILVLSGYAVPLVGPGVLAIGAARYAIWVAAWVVPWMRRAVPPRYWRKPVAAIQGVVLTATAAFQPPGLLVYLAIAVAMILLAESFGRDIVWQWRRRRLDGLESPDIMREPRPGHHVLSRALTAAAVLLVWLALIFPDQWSRLTPGALVRLPAEGLLLIAVALVLPGVAQRVVATVAGLVLGLLAILKIINLGFFSVLGRPFNPLTDASYLASAAGVLRDSTGPVRTVAAVVVTILGLGALVLLLTWSARRLTRFAGRHRATSAWTVGTLAAGWLLCAALGLQVAGGRVAVTSATAFTRVRVDPALTQPDPFAERPGTDLLTGLRGKDVLIVFVESYGRVAVEDPVIAPGVTRVLADGTASLSKAGYSTRSAYLTSPTYAGISWLAHGTLQSGLWIDNQQRYNQLLQSNRLTLSSAFQRAGWRTVAADPSNDRDWPEGIAFYRHQTVYDRRNVGYRGPSFSYASMPDQYTLAALERNELTPRRAPLMAEVDLVSSHGPWAPLPRMVSWDEIGDGSMFNPMPGQGQSPKDLLGDADKTKAAYGQSIQYSLSALISFIEWLHDDNLVVIAVGDHQPAAVVSGPEASHDVPITVIAHDPAVMARISSWGWAPGLQPSAEAPVWPMDAFRDRFLTAYEG